jgi:hypothetical protein
MLADEHHIEPVTTAFQMIPDEISKACFKKRENSQFIASTSGRQKSEDNKKIAANSCIHPRTSTHSSEYGSRSSSPFRTLHNFNG